MQEKGTRMIFTCFCGYCSHVTGKLCLIFQELLNAGCIFQERQGRERPGWFSTEGAAPVPRYDWFGAYGHALNTDHRYEDQLKKELTFGVPGNHELVIFHQYKSHCSLEVVHNNIHIAAVCVMALCSIEGCRQIYMFQLCPSSA